MERQKITITSEIQSERDEPLKKTRKSIKDTPAFKIWAERKDMENVSSYIRKLRESRCFD